MVTAALSDSVRPRLFVRLLNMQVQHTTASRSPRAARPNIRYAKNPFGGRAFSAAPSPLLPLGEKGDVLHSTLVAMQMPTRTPRSEPSFSPRFKRPPGSFPQGGAGLHERNLQSIN